MRLKYTFVADVTEDVSGREVIAPIALDGWKASQESLENHMDPDIADSGVVGGEIHTVTSSGQAKLEVTYWIPNGLTKEMLERIQTYTVAQLDDGVGEGGFLFDAGVERWVVTADTSEPATVEIMDDGRKIGNPSQIAIAARDGNRNALVAAIEADQNGVEKLHQGYSALQLAILYGRVEAVHILIAAGADANRIDPNGSTPLELCALSNSIDDEQSRAVAQILLEAGANPGHIAPNGHDARGYAVLRKKIRMAEVL